MTANPIVDKSFVIGRIMKVIEAREMDQYELESAMAFPKGRLSRWKSGVGEPSARQVFAISQRLGVPMEYFVNPAIKEVKDIDRPSDDEQYILRMVRDLNMNPQEVVRRLHAPTVSIPAEPSVPPTITDSYTNGVASKNEAIPKQTPKSKKTG